MLRNVTDLVGRKVQAVDGELGRVEDLYFDIGRWVVRYVAAGAGLQGKIVLLSPLSIIESGLEAGGFRVNLTKAQVAGSPEIDLGKPLTRQLEERIAEHYHWPRYWETSPRAIGQRRSTAVAERVFAHALTGARNLIDHAVLARDGEAGIVNDMQIDDGSWDVRHIVVGIAGKPVLLDPGACTYEPGKAALRTDLSREEVAQGAPAAR